jgi:hypothetical protein
METITCGRCGKTIGAEDIGENWSWDEDCNCWVCDDCHTTADDEEEWEETMEETPAAVIAAMGGASNE